MIEIPTSAIDYYYVAVGPVEVPHVCLCVCVCGLCPRWAAVLWGDIPLLRNFFHYSLYHYIYVSRVYLVTDLNDSKHKHHKNLLTGIFSGSMTKARSK